MITTKNLFPLSIMIPTMLTLVILLSSCQDENPLENMPSPYK